MTAPVPPAAPHPRKSTRDEFRVDFRSRDLAASCSQRVEQLLTTGQHPPETPSHARRRARKKFQKFLSRDCYRERFRDWYRDLTASCFPSMQREIPGRRFVPHTDVGGPIRNQPHGDPASFTGRTPDRNTGRQARNLSGPLRFARRPRQYADMNTSPTSPRPARGRRHTADSEPRKRHRPFGQTTTDNGRQKAAATHESAVADAPSEEGHTEPSRMDRPPHGRQGDRNNEA